MRKSAFMFAFLFCSGMLLAQHNEVAMNQGDVLVLGEPSGARYQHIDFPRKNIIIKRGAIPNFNAIIGEKLVVHTITTHKNGKHIATLKRKDGLNFFRFFPKVRADITKAIASKELYPIN